MKIPVKVKTNARQNAIKKIDEHTFEVSVTATPIDGKANEAVIKALADYFDVPKSRITIQKGASSRIKHIDILFLN